MLNRAFQEPEEDRDPIPAGQPAADDSAGKVLALPLRPAEPAEAAPERLPKRALAYVVAVCLLGVASVAWFAPRIETSDITGLVVIGVLAVAFGRTKIPIYGETTVSIGMVGDVAVALVFGPAGAVIVAPFSAAVSDFASGSAWYKRLFNIGANVVVNVLMAAVAWGLMGGGLSINGWLIPVTLLAALVYYLVNISLVTVAVGLAAQTPLRAVWREKFEWLVPHYVVFALLGAALADAYRAIGIAGVLAFVAPPVMMRFSLKQYIDKTAENVEELRTTNRHLQKANQEILHMATELRETYDGTLEALVSALDARDRETKGHSIRVAKYMMEIAYYMGIEPGTEEWVDMQRGALLHDVGKIGVSDTILHKPGPLTDEEWVDMRRHPKIGHDMLKEISFLSGAANIVLAHHERFDGKGYPKGLAADEIPLGARIFVLADTFDAMTSDRPYRRALSVEASRDEIIKCSGTQFDPRCVQAFLTAFDKVVQIRMADHEEISEHHGAAAPRQAA
jgi:putative nucleotidyltransferase with HDIG domain